jgi:hypothetical protein
VIEKIAGAGRCAMDGQPRPNAPASPMPPPTRRDAATQPQAGVRM